MPTQISKAVVGVDAYALRQTTDTHWTDTAGLTGATFADRGVYVGLFRESSKPVAGVTITAGGTTAPADDYYFSDATAGSLTTVAPAQSATGTNGAGLMIGDPAHLTQYSGMGGEPVGCKWPSDPGAQPPGMAFVQARLAVLTTQTTMICP
jgi:hypothetical protein